MKHVFPRNPRWRRRLLWLLSLSAGLILVDLASDAAYAQAKGGPIPSRKLGPSDGYAVAPRSGGGVGGSPNGKEAIPQIEGNCPEWLKNWDFTLSVLYQFSDERSKIRAPSFDSNSAIIDLTGRYIAPP